MKRLPKLKWFLVLGTAILLSLATGVAVSAIGDIDSGRHLPAAVEQLLASWGGSKPMIALAVLCIVLAIAGKGIERR